MLVGLPYVRRGQRNEGIDKENAIQLLLCQLRLFPIFDRDNLTEGNRMDLKKVIDDLRSQLNNLNQAIIALENMSVLRPPRRGRPRTKLQTAEREAFVSPSGDRNERMSVSGD
jgi:hypothetical protein